MATGKRHTGSLQLAKDAFNTVLMPKCCGMKVITHINSADDKALKEAIEAVPEYPVYDGETINPSVVFVNLNASQYASKAMRDMMAANGFVKLGQGVNTGWAGAQIHMFVRGPFRPGQSDEPVSKDYQIAQSGAGVALEASQA